MHPIHKVSRKEFHLGQYAFPISFFPLRTPTLFYQEGNGWEAPIEFKVKIILGPTNPKFPKLRFKGIIFIEKGKSLEGSSLKKESIFGLTASYCSYGETKITLELAKTALIPGETKNMKFTVDNSQGRLDFNNISCELERRLNLEMLDFTLKIMLW